MTSQLGILVSFFIYLAFFGWLGWRRGSKREFIVFIVAITTWFLLQERGAILVKIANLGGAAITFAKAGGLGDSQADAFAAISKAPKFITADSAQTFLFVVWVAVFVLTYMITNVSIADKDSRRNGWAILMGMINGLFFAVAFVPSLVVLFGSDSTKPELGVSVSLVSLLVAGAKLLWNGVVSLWALIEPLGSLALLILLTAVLVFAASTIRSGAKAKS